MFNGYQALSIARGFADALRDGGYGIRACSILPDHVHLVVDRHERMAEKIAGHLKSAASRQLRADGLHPLLQYIDPATDRLPTPWAERCWKCFLNDEESIQQAIQYVQDNPIKDGKRPQRWPFVRPFCV